uniref:CEP170 C-terminal domain-containing protein n=1 Tax=Salarias fasciatus TaxID=181472 RepID=A0A672H1G1_SALFA
MRDWTAHSEEIARISQDLAKDLAMLAREIHDVAGEIDSVSPAAADPGALVHSSLYATTTLEERVFDDSLDQGRPSAEHGGAPGTNGRSVELRQRGSNGQSTRSIRRQTWNREDVTCFFVHFTFIYFRINLASRILFKDKERKWEEIETKLQEEHDSLLLKSSSKEISTILQDLKRVERQLIVIDMMVDPDGTLDALTTLGITSPLSDLKMGPGAQQGASVSLPGADAPSGTLSAPQATGAE